MIWIHLLFSGLYCMTLKMLFLTVRQRETEEAQTEKKSLNYYITDSKTCLSRNSSDQTSLIKPPAVKEPPCLCCLNETPCLASFKGNPKWRGAQQNHRANVLKEDESIQLQAGRRERGAAWTHVLTFIFSHQRFLTKQTQIAICELICQLNVTCLPSCLSPFSL